MNIGNRVAYAPLLAAELGIWTLIACFRFSYSRSEIYKEYIRD